MHEAPCTRVIALSGDPSIPFTSSHFGVSISSLGSWFPTSLGCPSVPGDIEPARGGMDASMYVTVTVNSIFIRGHTACGHGWICGVQIGYLGNECLEIGGPSSSLAALQDLGATCRNQLISSIQPQPASADCQIFPQHLGSASSDFAFFVRRREVE